MIRVSSASPASRFTPGAGRVIDWSWPSKFSNLTDGAAPGNPGCFARNGGVLSSDNTSSATIIGTGTETYQARNGGMPFLFYTSNHVVDNGMIRQIDAMTMLPNLAAAGDMGDFSGQDDFHCIEAGAVLRFFSTGVFTRDCGIQWIVGALHGLVTNKPQGFGFCLTAADTVSFIWATGGALAPARVIRKTSAAELGNTWHRYSVRIIGATATSNAKLKVLVDGFVVLVLDWVVDGLPYPDNGGVTGFHCNLITNGGNDLLVAIPPRVRYVVAPTEEALV